MLRSAAPVSHSRPGTRTRDSADAGVNSALLRPRVCGPFLFVDGRKLIIKGVTYGTFSADAQGQLFPPRERVRRDFAAMRAAQINTVRVYTAPPDWLLEEARLAQLRVLVGIYWEGRNCNLEEPHVLQEARAEVRRV